MKAFFPSNDGKKRKVSLDNVTPSDPSFLIAQESDESVFPPTMLENEQLALKRSAWKAAYHAAQDEEAFASVEVLCRDYLSFQNELREKRLRFDNVMRCINTVQPS